MPYDPLLPAYNPATDAWVIGRVVYPEDMARLATRAAVAVVTTAVGSAQTAPQVTAAITTALSTLPDGTTITFTGGKLSVIGSASIPALPSAMVTTDLFDVQRAGSTYTATLTQIVAAIGAAPVAGTGTTPAATPFADVTGASWTIEQIAARVAAINGAVAVPGQVTALTIGIPTSSSLPLTWTAPSTGGAVSAYTVEERLTGGTTYSVCSTSVTTTSYVIPGLVAGTAYDVRVTATNASGSGTPSAVVSATTAGAAATAATAATLANVPTTGKVGTAITGVTATLTPAGVTAFAVLFTGTADVGTRVSFTGTAVPTLTPATAASHTIRLYAAATGGTALVESAAIAVAAAPSGPANTLQIAVLSVQGGAVTLSNTYNGYSYDNIITYFNLTKAGVAVPTNSTTVVTGWSISATVPPPAASHVISGTILSNGYATASQNSVNYFNMPSGVAVTTGSSPSPGSARYIWSSDDSGTTWSVYRDSSNVAIVYMVIG